MLFIAHRGNTEGPNQAENKPDYIERALQIYNAEIDVWYWKGNWYLGHDEPIYTVTLDWLSQNGLWLHAKNYEALELLCSTKLNFFWHQTDNYTITSHRYIWAYPGHACNKNGIVVMPEWYDTQIEGQGGICSDYIRKYYNDQNYNI